MTTKTNNLLKKMAIPALAASLLAGYSSANMIADSSSGGYASSNDGRVFAGLDLGVTFFNPNISIGLNTLKPSLSDVNILGSNRILVPYSGGAAGAGGTIALRWNGSDYDIATTGSTSISIANGASYTFTITRDANGNILVNSVDGVATQFDGQFNVKNRTGGVMNLFALSFKNGAITPVTISNITTTLSGNNITLSNTSGSTVSLNSGTIIGTMSAKQVEAIFGDITNQYRYKITGTGTGTDPFALQIAVPTGKPEMTGWLQSKIPFGSFASFAWQLVFGYYFNPCMGVDFAVGTYSAKHNAKDGVIVADKSAAAGTVATASARVFTVSLIPEIFYEVKVAKDFGVRLIGGLGGAIVNAKYTLASLSANTLKGGVKTAVTGVNADDVIAIDSGFANTQINVFEGADAAGVSPMSKVSQLSMIYRLGIQATYDINENASLGLKYYIANQPAAGTSAPQRVSMTTTYENAGKAVTLDAYDASTYWKNAGGVAQTVFVTFGYVF